jgi:hypothetical protein
VIVAGVTFIQKLNVCASPHSLALVADDLCTS